MFVLNDGVPAPKLFQICLWTKVVLVTMLMLIGDASSKNCCMATYNCWTTEFWKFPIYRVDQIKWSGQ